VYSETVEEHAWHLEAVFQSLKEIKLCANEESDSFAWQRIEVLDHVATKDASNMTKVKTNQEWKWLVIQEGLSHSLA